MNEKIIVERFLQLGNSNRVYALGTILHEMGFDFDIEPCGMYTGDKCNNVIVDFSRPGEKYNVFVAHHDLWGNSTGINDNTVAIATLLMVLHEHRFDTFSKSFKILFPDKEESGMVGSNHFARKYRDEIEEVIVLDIVGYGDKLTWASSSKRFEYLNDHDIANINTILPSDNLTFEMNGIPAALIVAAHDQDLTYVEGNYFNLSTKPKFYESFHERAMDGKLEVINWPLVVKLRNILYELIK